MVKKKGGGGRIYIGNSKKWEKKVFWELWKKIIKK